MRVCSSELLSLYTPVTSIPLAIVTRLIFPDSTACTNSLKVIVLSGRVLVFDTCQTTKKHANATPMPIFVLAVTWNLRPGAFLPNLYNHAARCRGSVV